PSPHNERHRAGFHHEDCGRLLCPISYDWGDETIRQGLRDRTLIARPGDFPYVLYANERYDPQNPFEGFMKNGILAYRHVSIGPLSALTEDGDGSGKAGNAALNGVTSVTSPSLAYIATIVSTAVLSPSRY
ncbi:hypothetical protein PLICRDRAFT_83261, partial [Plicaturopsis crispa FD-325 SS-3]